MDNYTPDCWVFIKLTEKDTGKVHDRVLCSWYGGFAGSDYWKISSGNLEVIDRGDHWEVPQHSGSVYFLYKKCRRMSGLMTSIFNRYSKNSESILNWEVV